ncbi:MAG: hypothetical protein ACI39R_03475 [Lachnospiraceae bacterium]
MKKKLLVLGGGLATIIAAILLIVFIHWILAIFLILCAAAVLIYVCMDGITERIMNADKPTSYFSDLSGRNMDGIVVGASKAWKYVNKKHNKNLYYALAYGSTTNMEFNVLKTYFSHVKNNGTVYFVYDNADGISNKRITPIDNKMIHQHVFLQLGIKLEPEKCKRPFSSFRKFMSKYVICYFARKAGFYRSKSWKISHQVGSSAFNSVDTAQKLLCQVIDFCKERDLQVNVLLLDSKSDINAANRKLCESITTKYGDGVARIVKSSNELNMIISK